MPTNPVFTPVDGSGNVIGPSASTLVTYASGVQATSNTGTSFATSTVSGLAVDITLTSFTGGTSPSVTFFIDRQGADTVWYRIWTSSALTTAGATSVQIGPWPSGTGIVTAILTGTARFGWTTAGTPTAVTFSASVIGR